MCAAVAAVHAASFVHGDIKSSNVLLDGQLHATLTVRPSSPSAASRCVLRRVNCACSVVVDMPSQDLGDSRKLVTAVAFTCESVAESPSAVSATCTSPATRKSARPSSCRAAYNVNVGTDGYRAPEARAAAAFTAAADTYSVGVVLLELLSGQPPMAARGGSCLADRVRAALKVRHTPSSLPMWSKCPCSQPCTHLSVYPAPYPSVTCAAPHGAFNESRAPASGVAGLGCAPRSPRYRVIEVGGVRRIRDTRDLS